MARGADLSTQDRELIDRYLAGRLDDDELNRIEARFIADPGFRREVEITEALRTGLRQLEERGELDALRAPESATRFWQRPAYALAASVATAFLAVTSVALYRQIETEREQVSRIGAELRAERTVSGAGLSDLGLKPNPSSAAQTLLSFQLSRAAGADGSNTISRTLGASSTLLMDFDVGAEPAPAYLTTISLLSAAGSVPVLELPGLTPAPNGGVRLILNSALLPPGTYEIRLQPVHGQTTDGRAPGDDEPSLSALTYRLQVLP
jgi:hypothetical protein